MQSIQRDGSVAVGEMSFAKRQNGDGSVAMRETNSAERQNVREIVERIESLNRSQKNYQTCQYVCGSQVPPSQDDVGKKSSMHRSIVASHKRHLPRQTFIRPTLLDYDDYHKKITPKRSYVDSEEELDETTSSSSNGRSLEMSDEEASSSSSPHSPELSDATASSSSNPRSLMESCQTASSSSSPHSSYSWTSQQQTTGSGGSGSGGSDEDPEDYYDRGDHPPRVKGPSKRYRSPSHKKKATGRLRGLKNKLGLIFHHHHHHHHHHHEDNDVSSKKKQKAGHFRALVKGLMKHSKHSKKSKPSKDGIGRQLGRIQNGHDNKHWWKMFQRHRRGVRLPNRGRVKLGIPRKNKKPRLKTLK
ncbi:hypothetical protein OIU85_008504 [Salix viminalis]|uniref:Uncharacterized protein n=1 Tax=Salix viminalis TaxID=40686 RepID=A0A9Q0SHF7_SALVM|nr:hypothetical protein OIU85_008504 [Salix viminalis]